jgi:hypothetical protein
VRSATVVTGTDLNIMGGDKVIYRRIRFLENEGFWRMGVLEYVGFRV